MDIVLALGGGGIKGVAHIPVLEALDDLGLRPKAIAGTSIGALVGSAYAAGFTGVDLRSHVEALASNKAGAIWAMIKDPRNRPLGGVLDPEAVFDVCAPEGLPTEFEDLSVPFTAITTDYFTRECLPLQSGNLRTAVAASIAIPGIFAPVSSQGRTLVDGGLVSNLPVRQLPSGFSIAVDVLDYPEPNDGTGRIKAAVGALQIMIKRATEAEIDAHPPGLLLTPDTAGAGPLDFGRIGEILDANEDLREEVKRAVEAASTALN